MRRNNNWDHQIHRAMLHPLNRKIIDCLRDENLSFTDLLNKVSADGNHGKFGYHLRTLSEFVELEPSTKEYRLTDRGKLLAVVIRDFRTLTSRGKEVLRYVEGLTSGDHAVAFYDDDDFKRRISFPFLKAGLSRGEAAVYIVSEDKLDSDIREIQKHDIDLDSLPKGAFTIIPDGEWYLRKGRLTAKTITTNWQTLIHKKKKAGFAGVHAAGEPAVFFRNGEREELLRYEESLGRRIALDLCALCLYNKRVLEERHIARVLHSHGHIISEDLLGKTVG
jgi:hypothetical protein